MDHHNACRQSGRWLLVLLLLIVFAFALNEQSSFAAEVGKAGKFPSRPVRIYIPAGAGGSLAREIRTITPFLEKRLGVPVPVEYITGADGIIGYNKIYQEKPNGGTIISFNLSSAVSLELTRDAAKYEVKKLSPIAVWNLKTHALVTHPDRWKSFSDFLEDAKKKPVSMAVVGGSSTFQGYLMESALGIKVNWVPYGDSGESMAAVAGKHADALITFTLSPLPMIRAGKLKALAVFSAAPDPISPDIPNFKDLGHLEIPFVIVYGVMMAPPNTPKEITSTLENAVKEATALPEFRKMAETIGMTVDFRPGSELQKLVANEYEITNKYKQFLK